MGVGLFFVGRPRPHLASDAHFHRPTNRPNACPQQVVELHNCFGVPHAESGNEVALGQDYHRSMNAQFARVNDKERIVGWCVLFLFFR